MKKIILPFSIFIAVSLTGCGDDKPSDKLASETVRKFANSDLTEGLEISDFTRENGWVDNDAPNRYKVRYTYNLRLTKPYSEVVLSTAKKIKEEFDANARKATGGLFDTNTLQNNVDTMQLSMTVNKWVQDQGDGFIKRRDDFLNTCAPCTEYWNSEDAPNEAKLRRQTFISSWIYLEGIGFKDTFKVGDSVPRNAWAAFIKTEKGWKPAE